MREIAVEILQSGKSTRLLPGPNNINLAEGDVLLSVSGTNAPVFLNDAPQNLQSLNTGVRIGALNLSNRPGLHRVSINSRVSSIDFEFATSTAKAAWVEIEAMIEATRLYSLGIGRPFLYLGSDGPRQVEGLEQIMIWLRDRWRELSQLAVLIDKAPAARMLPRLRTASRARGMDLRATAALLRERPTLMEETTHGGIEVGETRYWPSLVRARTVEASIPQAEHRQLRTLLRRLLSVCRSVAPVIPEANVFIADLIKLLGLRTFELHASGPGEAYPAGIESAVERRDPRYRRLRQLELEFQLKFSHLEDPAAAIRAGLRDVWEIYQAFVAHTIGRALDLKYVSDLGDLRTRDSRGASMHGHGMRLFYDTQISSEYLSSWRASSERPAFERPDIVVIDELQKRVLVLDVKFSIGNNGQCRSEHLFEMQGYLNSYGLRIAGVVFPGDPSAAKDVSNGSMCLAEIPLRADTLLTSSDSSLGALRDRLYALWDFLPG